MLVLNESLFITWDERLGYYEVVLEKVRRLHNTVGTEFREGRITEAEWSEFKTREFDPKNNAVINAILALRAEPRTAARALADDSPTMLAVDLDAVFSEEADVG